MASNGLIANPSKTSLLILNNKNREENQIKIKIGKAIVTQEASAKLLGMTFNEKQEWSTHIFGKGGLISSLNSRIYMIRRLKNHLNKDALSKIIDGLFTSKLRYGLQLLGKVRRNEEDALNATLAAVQRVQNNLVRMINGCKISDKVSIKSLLTKSNMLSINQLNAQIKLTEMWKAVHFTNYPIDIPRKSTIDNAMNTRACTEGRLVESGLKPLTQRTFIYDATRLWNTAPSEITNAKSLDVAKSEIKKFVKTLPI